MRRMDRRDAMAAMGASVAMMASLASDGAMAQPSGSAPPRPPHEPKSLPFDPARLSGLSERLILSHWENNYTGSVKALNMVEARLAAAMADPDFPALIYGDLIAPDRVRRASRALFREPWRRRKSGRQVQAALARAFGSFAAWEAEFRRTAASLGGGSGWAVLALNTHTGTLDNYWMWDHMHAPATGLPLLALDMYEHSYHVDYGSAAARYIDAFMVNVNWEEVNTRFTRARRAGAVA